MPRSNPPTRIAISGVTMLAERLKTGHTNASYRISTRSGIRLLRIGVDRVAADLEYERQLSLYLRSRGQHVPKVFGSAFSVRGPAGSRPALMFDWIYGDCPHSEAELFRVGRELSRLHSVPVPAFARRSTATPEAAFARSDGIVCDGFGLPSLVALAEEFVDEAAYSVFCHGELFATNILVDSTTVWFIDLETMGAGHPLLDLGTALNGTITTETPSIDVRTARALLDGYGRVDERRAGRAAAIAAMKPAWWRHRNGRSDWLLSLQAARSWLTWQSR